MTRLSIVAPILILVVGSLVFVKSGAPADQGGAATPPTISACVTKPTDQLCSTIPHDVLVDLGFGYGSLTQNLQTPFDVFSWQSFIALNWPANPDGTPANGPISDVDSPRVWQFYKTPFDVFPALKSYLESDKTCPQSANGRSLRVFRLNSKGGLLPTGDFLEATTHKPLIDHNLNFVLYDIALNDEEVSYITTNHLDTKAGQEMYTKPIQFPLGKYADPQQMAGGPVGAIEIKSAWRILDPAYGDKLDHYYTVDGLVSVDADNSEGGQAFCFQAKLGLVGFHIIHSVSGPKRSFAQDWIWSTFEHVDNAPLERVFKLAFSSEAA